MRNLLVAFLLILSPTAASAQPAAVDSVGTALAGGHNGGVVVGWLDEDRTETRGFGSVDSTGQRPTARTLFEIGSVTKALTGLLLADAIERGLVDADTPVRSLLPDTVDWTYADSVAALAQTMTLEHLATHRSGLPRLPSNLRAVMASPQDPYAAYGDSALYAALDDAVLPRAPGTRYEYSNLGMGLLGHLLARRADTTYAALVRRRITAPLGLSDTRIHLTDAQQSRFAQGHNRAGAPAPPWHFDALAGAGALRSTAADMLAFLQEVRRALAADRDTASRLQRAMQRAATPQASTDGDSTRVGFGWHQFSWNGHEVLGHTGGTGGFRSVVALDRTTGHGVVVLVSTAVSSRQVAEAGKGLLRALRSH
jgi:CubicO group peptidase (beta-lactamase class C family)